MAGQVAFDSSFKLLDSGQFSKQQLCMPKSSPMLMRRGFCFGSCKVSCLPSSSILKVITPYSIKLETKSNMRSSKKCFCLASLIDADAALASEWVPTIDKMLLMTSIVLTYIAGVIPSERKSPSDARGNVQNRNVDGDNSSFFGRKAGVYNDSLFVEHGVSILEDLVIMVADGIASMYLELISVDSSMSNELSNIGLSLCTLSSRALQKLRNEVALNQWLHQNMEAVVSMYEDRFDLCTFQCQLIEESSKSKFQNVNWWEKLRVMSSQPVLSQLNTVVINQISLPAKRTKELRALTGWRYYYSLLLELADIGMPLIRTVISKLSDAISFFLVCLIGRSLGLIYTGIRQSLRWK